MSRSVGRGQGMSMSPSQPLPLPPALESLSGVVVEVALELRRLVGVRKSRQL